ncbi:MAG: protein SCO1/2 [Planctomycetaceae bacterium]|jgi:protein SCO1/2
MNHRSAILAVVMALGAVGYFAGYCSPLTKDLEAARENRWMNDVARDAMQQSEIGSGSDSLKAAETDENVQRRVSTLETYRIPTATEKRVSARFPNTDLIDQHGRKLKFYDDLVKDTSVCIVFFYTRCTGSCPGTTTALKQIRRTIAQEFPNDEFRFISLTLEPDVDTPEELQEYMDRYRISEDPSLPEWVYATGDFEEVDHLRRELGVYDLDPIIDADKTEHAAIVTFGNDRTDRWAALPVGMGVGKVSETIVRITGNTPRQRYANTLLVRHVTPEQASTAAAADSCCSEKSKACCSKTAN